VVFFLKKKSIPGRNPRPRQRFTAGKNPVRTGRKALAGATPPGSAARGKSNGGCGSAKRESQSIDSSRRTPRRALHALPKIHML
jgi:hypothetical protein